MKEETVLNVLMYLFRHHMHNHNIELDATQSKLTQQLEKIGFRRKVINQAFDWLDKLAQGTNTPIILQKDHAMRIYSPYEQERLDADCQGFILFLEQQNILTPHTRELVVSQALELNAEKLDISLIKWVTLMVLFNQADDTGALACMEYLVLDETMGAKH